MQNGRRTSDADIASSDCTNESEAETEILHASARNTPVKRRRLSSPTVGGHRAQLATNMRDHKSAPAPQRGHVHAKSEFSPHSDHSDLSSAAHRDLSSVPPRTRSESPKNLHQRSASFQSALPSTSRNLRSRSSRESPDQKSIEPHHPPETHFPTASDPVIMPAKSRYGRTPLLQACFRGDEQHVKELLVDFPGDLERGDNAEVRPLQAAALEGETEIVKMLLDAGAEPNIRNNEGDTPLIEAITNRHVEIVNMLLDAGANPWRKNGHYQMPKDLTEELPDDVGKELERALLKAADARIKNGGAPDHLPLKPVPDKSTLYEGFSVDILEKYCKLGIMEKVMYQLSTRVKPNLACAIAAAKGGHVDILKRLHREGMDLDPIPDSAGDTPILAAIGRGNLEVVRHLINSEGFDATRRFEGRTYQQIAFARKGPDMKQEIQILREAAEQTTTQATPENFTPISGKLGLATVATIEKSERMNLNATLQAGEKRKRLRTKAELDEEQHQKEEAKLDLEAKVWAKHYLDDAERQMRERREYLRSLPHAIGCALNAGSHVLPAIINPKERPWKTSLRNWHPIEVVKRSEIEKDCLAGSENQLFLHNLFSAIHLHHETLTKSKELGMNTLPMTRQQHIKYFEGTWASGDVAWDRQWWNGPVEAREYAVGKFGWELEEYNVLGSTTGKKAWKIKNRAVYEIEARKRMMELADGQFYWLELKQFIEATAGCAWLRDFFYESENNVHFVPRDQRTPTQCPRWKNGKIFR